MFNLASFLNILKLAPYVFEGVNTIHSEASIETKNQIATDALTLAAGVTEAVIPGEAAIVGAAQAGIQAIIGAISSVKAATASPQAAAGSTSANPIQVAPLPKA